MGQLLSVSLSATKKKKKQNKKHVKPADLENIWDSSNFLFSSYKNSVVEFLFKHPYTSTVDDTEDRRQTQPVQLYFDSM